MATSHVFNNQEFFIPGVRSRIKSGITNPPVALPFGVTLIIDTGTGATFGGGAGISGTLIDSPKDAFYTLEDIDVFQEHVKGGLWWLLADPLFRPSRPGIPGISQAIYVRAAETTPSEIVLSMTGGGTNGGDVTIQVRDEGLIGDGELLNNELVKGYAAIMRAGVDDTSKFIFDFYRGTFKGLDSNNRPYDGIAKDKVKPELLVSSPEFDNVQELIDWMNDDFNFNLFFKLKSSVVNGDGSVDSADLTSLDDYTLATGGFEDYTAAAYTKVLDELSSLFATFVFSDVHGDPGAQDQKNVDLLNKLLDSKFKPELYIAAGTDQSEFEFSKQTAAFFDNDSVTVVHAGKKIRDRNPIGDGFRSYDAMYHAALVLGREAGLAPENPISFKDIRYSEDIHKLNDKEVRQGLKAGIVMSRKEETTFDIVKGVNSLQDNKFLVNEDGTTHSKQIKRIARQLNNEIIVNAKADLLKGEDGPNRITISEEVLIKWVERYLTDQVGTLILGFEDISAVRVGDSWRVTYRFTPNSEINFLFFTGLIINV